MPFHEILRRVSTFAFGLALLGMVTQIGFGVWSQYVDSRRAYREYKQQSQADQEQSAREIADRYSIIVDPLDTIRACLVKEILTYQAKDATNKDLKAQQDMALWAFWTFIATTGGLIVSIGGLTMLWASLRQTRQAISLDREVGHAQVRAYVTVNPKAPKQIGDGLRPITHITIVNTGQSPTYDVAYIATILVADFPLKSNDVSLIIPGDGQVIPAGTTIAAGGDIMAEAVGEPLDAETVKAVMGGGSKRLYLCCNVYYRDVFRIPRHTFFTAYLGRDWIEGPVKGPSGKEAWAYQWMIARTHNSAT